MSKGRGKLGSLGREKVKIQPFGEGEAKKFLELHSPQKKFKYPAALHPYRMFRIAQRCFKGCYVKSYV